MTIKQITEILAAVGDWRLAQKEKSLLAYTNPSKEIRREVDRKCLAANTELKRVADAHVLKVATNGP